MTPVREFATRDALMRAAAERIADALNQAIAERGAGCAALSGGSTPEPAYRALAAMPVDWPKVTFLLVDERFVPPTDAASNEAMVRRALAPALSTGARLLPMFAENATLDEATALADASYASEEIDIALMGMGDDGHTASWFPQSPELEDVLDLSNPHTVVSVHALGAAGSAQRITLTHRAVARARHRVLLLAGEQKRRSLRAHIIGTPVAALLELGTDILWGP